MATANTKTTLDTMFKYKIAKDVNNLMPSCAIIQKMIPKLSQATKTGRKFLWPTALTFENGVTYGDDTAFSYNAAVAGVYDEIEIDSYPVVLRSQVALSAANRMASDEQAFITNMSLRSGNMKESITKRAEIECLYGKAGLGIISSITKSSAGVEVIVFTDASWAPGLWGGMEGSLLEIRDASASGVAGHSTNSLTLTSVDVDAKSITVTGNETELDAAAATNVVYFFGAYSNSMYGIDKQLTNDGAMFGINASTYNLWAPNSYAVGGNLTMAKVLKGVAKAVGKGGLSEDCVLLVSSLTYEGLNSDLAALRQFDGSYKRQKGENGVSAIEYNCQAGLIKIVAHPMVKEGEAFLIPEKGIKRIGATEVSFGFGDGDYFEKLEGTAGYQLLAQYDWCILIEKPAKCVKYTGITNS